MELCEFCQVSNVSTVIRCFFFGWWLVSLFNCRRLWIVVGGLPGEVLQLAMIQLLWICWRHFGGRGDGVMCSPWPKNQEETLTQLGSWLCLKRGGYQGYHKWWRFQQGGFGVPDFETPCMAVVRRNVFPFERVSWPQETRSFPRVDQPCLLWNVCSLPNHWGTIVNKHPKLALKSTKMETVNVIFTKYIL